MGLWVRGPGQLVALAGNGKKGQISSYYLQEALPTIQEGGQCSRWRGKLTTRGCLVQGKVDPTEVALPPPPSVKRG